jgi:hypothetical protein
VLWETSVGNENKAGKERENGDGGKEIERNIYAMHSARYFPQL